MNILFLVNRYPGVGGIENMTTQLACLFKTELGNDTCIFSVEGQVGIEVDSSLKKNNIDLKIADTTDKSLIVKSFIRFLDVKKPDVVIFQDSYAPIEYLLSYISKPTRIFTVEHNTPDCFIKSYIQHWKSHQISSLGGLIRKIAFPYVYYKILLRGKIRHKKLVKLSDKYILLSSSYMPILKRYFNIVNDNIIAIPNIRNSFRINREVSFLSYPLQKKKQFLFVGRLNSQKGVDKLVEVWCLLEPKIPDYELLIVGDGEQRKLLEMAIRRYGLKQIKIEGFKFNVVDYYRDASAFFMTSVFEGLPLVLAEAMQFGVIPFAFDSFSSLHDIIENEKSGFIIKPFDTEFYANSVCRFLMMDKNEVENLRKSAIEASEIFTVQNVLYKWKELFDSVV